MEGLESEQSERRRKRTRWLMAAGAASLLVPLAGAVYLHWLQNTGAPGPSGRSDVFERREGLERKIVPTQTAVMAPPTGLAANAANAGKPAGSSLDFVKTSADMQPKTDPPPQAAAPAPPPAPPPPAPAPAKPKKPGKKPFTMPKLQPTRGFTKFGSNGANGAAQGGATGGANVQDMLKALTPKQ